MTTDELTWLPAWRINELVVNKEVSPVEVTEHFLGRIEELEPTLHAFRTLDAAGAREQAQQAEDAIRQGAAVGPLHGIPVAVKEHIAVKGLPFSLTGPQHAPIAKRDDILTERLRAAGAIMVGTTVMPGMGNSPTAGRKPSDDLSDQPRNPWDPTRVPGSSSAGSAAATASGMLPFTIGSDGGGSTRLPSALSGVVGLHTTARRIPFVTHRLEGLPLTGSFGPITRDVRDAAIALQVMAGPDGRDFVCLQDDPPDYSAGLDAGVEGVRFAWTDDFGFGSMYALEETPRVISAVREAAFGFTMIGATVEPTEAVWEDFWPGSTTTSQAYGPGPQGAGGGRPSRAQYLEAVESRAGYYERFRRLFAASDLLLSPTIQFTAFTVEGWDAAWNHDGTTYPHGTFAPTYTTDTHMFNWLGWPAISVPCGFLDGLPVALQIVGCPNSEALILRAAAAFLKAYPRAERPTIAE